MALQISNSIFLTVLGPAPPIPTVTTPSGVSRASREVMQPFQFDTAGRLGSVTDAPTMMAMHMLDLLFTRPGERVMEPRYGIGAQDYVFEPIDSPIVADLVNTTSLQVGTWEPQAKLQSVQAMPSDPATGLLKLLVNFTVGIVPTQHVVTYNLSGQRIET